MEAKQPSPNCLMSHSLGERAPLSLDPHSVSFPGLMMRLGELTSGQQQPLRGKDNYLRWRQAVS